MKTFSFKKIVMQAVLWVAFLTTFISGQERAGGETIRVNTSIVFVAALVRDESNRKPAQDLERGDIELRVDGKTREITNLSKGGFEDCPLTLALYFNLAPNGATRYLSDVKAQRSLKEDLETRGEDDKVTVLASNDWFEGLPDIIISPTRDWNAVAMKIGKAVSDRLQPLAVPNATTIKHP